MLTILQMLPDFHRSKAFFFLICHFFFFQTNNNNNNYPRGDSQVAVAQDSILAPVNGNANLTCQLVGSAARQLRIKWVRSDGRSLPVNSYENRGELFIQNVQQSDGGPYSCQALDSNGRIVFTTRTTLTISSKSEILSIMFISLH